IDALGPRQDATLQVLGFLIALVFQELLRLKAAHAALAVDDDFAIRVQFLKALRQLRQRDERATGDSADLELLRIANVEHEKLLAAIKPSLEFLNSRFALAVCCGGSSSLLTAHAAELFVINELRDRGLVA